MTYPPQGYAPAQAPPAPVDREIVGVLTNVEVRGSGWHRFHIQEQNRQYPVKCDTKKPETIQQAMSLMGQVVAAQVRDQPSDNINPHTQKPYINHYLNGIAPSGFAPGVQPNPGATGPTGQVYQPPNPPQAPQPLPSPAYPQQAPQGHPGYPPMPQPTHSEPIGQDERTMQIMRQAAAKVVAASWQMLPVEQQNPQGLIEACETWLAYFVYGPLRFGIQPFAQPQQPQAAPQPHPAAQFVPQPQFVPEVQQHIDGGAPGPQSTENLFGDPGPQDGQNTNPGAYGQP